MDKSKPVGDACRKDGTLKDASKMDWPNSPTKYNPQHEDEFHNNITLLTQHEDQFHNNGSELKSSESEPDKVPKAKVRYITGTFYGTLTEAHPVASE